MSDLKWIKSSYSGAQSNNCVEIAALPSGDRVVRDSKNPNGAVLELTAGQWAELAKSLLRQEPGNGGAIAALLSRPAMVP